MDEPTSPEVTAPDGTTPEASATGASATDSTPAVDGASAGAVDGGTASDNSAASPQPGESASPAETAATSDGEPPWLMKTITRATWRIVWIVLIVLTFIWVLNQASTLATMLVVATFLALAMVPGVNSLVMNRGWSRGAATGVIFLVVFGSLFLLVGLLIPAVADMSGKLTAQVPQWADQLQKHGVPINPSSQTSSDLMQKFENWAKNSGSSKLLHAAGSGVEVMFEFFTVLMFTFLIASNEPSLRRVIMRRLSPSRQQKFQNAWDTAITQTGGYFYSRLLLMLITGTLNFAVMMILGLPFLYALPLAFFGAFFVEFIPVVGSYVGISIPVVVTLGERGVGAGLALLAWGIIYQQIHDYLLSPRISSKTMEINAGVAFGSALLGGALAGPIGALFALPAAGMVTVFLRNYLPSYALDSDAFLEEDELQKRADMSRSQRRAERKAARAKAAAERHAKAASHEGTPKAPSA